MTESCSTTSYNFQVMMTTTRTNLTLPAVRTLGKKATKNGQNLTNLVPGMTESNDDPRGRGHLGLPPGEPPPKSFPHPDAASLRIGPSTNSANKSIQVFEIGVDSKFNAATTLGHTNPAMFRRGQVTASSGPMPQGVERHLLDICTDAGFQRDALCLP